MESKILSEIEIIKMMDTYIESVRPPENIRDKIDIGYKIDGQSIIVHEIRPSWKDEFVMEENPVAKTTFVKKTGTWKIFWFRSDMKWHSYEPYPVAKNLKKFIAVLEADEHECFWG